MTREELEKEAEEYVSKYQGWGWTPHEGSAVYNAMLNSYIDSAEPREKRIAELEAQIEQMKSDVMRNVKWADQNKNEQMYCKLNAMFNQWEIKEND